MESELHQKMKSSIALNGCPRASDDAIMDVRRAVMLDHDGGSQLPQLFCQASSFSRSTEDGAVGEDDGLKTARDGVHHLFKEERIEKRFTGAHNVVGLGTEIHGGIDQVQSLFTHQLPRESFHVEGAIR